jgi:hypothetical protein
VIELPPLEVCAFRYAGQTFFDIHSFIRPDSAPYWTNAHRATVEKVHLDASRLLMNNYACYSTVGVSSKPSLAACVGSLNSALSFA